MLSLRCCLSRSGSSATCSDPSREGIIAADSGRIKTVPIRQFGNWNKTGGYFWDAINVKSDSTSAIHPPPAELAEFARGALEDARAAIVEDHVFRCGRCADVVAKTPGDSFQEQLRLSRAHWSLHNTLDHVASTDETLGLPVENLILDQVPLALRQHPRFEIKRLIAEGGMGRVYLARSRRTQKWIAVKVLKPGAAGDPRRISRFLQEARIAERLRHQNIAQVSECGSVDSTAYIALEFVRGKTLAQIIDRRGPLPFDEARECVCQASRGLACAASHGVVHRDIKPHNLMRQSDDRQIKILDFGLGRLVDEQRSGTRLTSEDDIIGTLEYISPEQAANSREADIRSDIYSLGCTLYFLLSGAPPFRGKNALDLLRKHENEQPTPIERLRPDVPVELARLLDSMLQKNPSLRPQSPAELVDALGGGAPTKVVIRSGTARSSNPSALVARFQDVCRSPAVCLPATTIAICLLWILWRWIVN
jgi:eukaryotic-like serine/threonine-protein kinase